MNFKEAQVSCSGEKVEKKVLSSYTQEENDRKKKSEFLQKGEKGEVLKKGTPHT